MKFRAVPIVIALLVTACAKAPAEKSESASEAAERSANEVLSTDKVLGDRNAPITLIEYASLTCPVCAAVAEQVLPDIEEKFIKTGKVKLVFREYPTHNPELSLAVSVLARCATEKSSDETYFTLIGGLFNTQSEWSENEAPRAALEKILGQAGLKGAAFDACLERRDIIDIVNANARSGIEEFGVQGTPAFVLDGGILTYKSKGELEGKIAAAIEKIGAP